MIIQIFFGELNSGRFIHRISEFQHWLIFHLLLVIEIRKYTKYNDYNKNFKLVFSNWYQSYAPKLFYYSKFGMCYNDIGRRIGHQHLKSVINISNRSPTSQIGHQHLEVVTSVNRIQYPLPRLVKPGDVFCIKR